MDINRYPSINLLKEFPYKNSLFETVIVTLNDELVKMFLNKKLNFNDINLIMEKLTSQKKFLKYKYYTKKLSEF